MTAMPPRLHATAERIYALHAARVAAETQRGYVGGSSLGHPCERHLWLAFRMAARETVEGRIARLFDTGHREEARLLDELRAIGCTVYDRDERGQQFGYSAVGGHFRAHLDAVVTGLPEAPATPHLVDVKTIKSTKLKDLLKKGVRSFNAKYWAQGTVYAYLAELERIAYFFVCKDDDTIHVERWQCDKAEARALLAKAERIVRAEEPPPRVSDDPKHEDCRYCPFAGVCHEKKLPAANCRTCVHSTPELDGDARWSCGHTGRDALTREEQQAGCKRHVFIPPLVDRVMTIQMVKWPNLVVWNIAGAGDIPQPPYQSTEIVAALNAGKPETLIDPMFVEMKETMGATLVRVDDGSLATMPEDVPW